MALGAVGLRFGGGGSGAGLITGEERKAVGEGIVIVSILTVSYTGTSTTYAGVTLKPGFLPLFLRCAVDVTLEMLFLFVRVSYMEEEV